MCFLFSQRSSFFVWIHIRPRAHNSQSHRNFSAISVNFIYCFPLFISISFCFMNVIMCVQIIDWRADGGRWTVVAITQWFIINNQIIVCVLCVFKFHSWWMFDCVTELKISGRAKCYMLLHMKHEYVRLNRRWRWKIFTYSVWLAP